VLVFPEMSGPTAKWNSSSPSSVGTRLNQNPVLGVLVTEGKCIKEVKNMSGWSAEKAPTRPRVAHHTLLPSFESKSHRAGVRICSGALQCGVLTVLGGGGGGEAGLGGRRRKGGEL